jgi:hypothetical protein
MKQYKDITGQKFGKLTILKYTKTVDKRPYWECKCDCGNIKEIRGKEIKSGAVKSCGCLKKERGPDKDLTNKKFNRLTAIKIIGKCRGHYLWECKCNCGNTVTVNVSSLLNSHVKSCGCLDSELASKRIRSLMKKRGGFKGKNNPRWRNDLTDEERKKRKEIRFITDIKKNKWIKKVYNRDLYKCQKCGNNKSGSLTAHHIYSWTSHPKLRYVTPNGITFCLDCHIKFHKKYGYGNNNRKQLTEYMCIL